jgi:hypothetical protein
MLLGSPVKRLLRRAAKRRLEKAELAWLAAAAALLLLLLLLLGAASLRCSAAALVAAHGRLWAGGVSIAASADADADHRPVSAPRAAAAGSGGGGEAAAAADEEGEECDLFDGEWVWAGAGAGGGGYPLYHSSDCPFLDVGFRCAENGRPDASYTKWRWQPSRCHLPRFVSSLQFSPATFLLTSPHLSRPVPPPSPGSGDFWFANANLARAKEACAGVLLSIYLRAFFF